MTDEEQRDPILKERLFGLTNSQGNHELLDKGIFDDNRYFDVFVEYAKASPEDVLMQVTVHNRGQDEARLHVLLHPAEPTAVTR